MHEEPRLGPPSFPGRQQYWCLDLLNQERLQTQLSVFQIRTLTMGTLKRHAPGNHRDLSNQLLESLTWNPDLERTCRKWIKQCSFHFVDIH